MEWKKPVITRVELDPEQAVLQVCSNDQGSGAWINVTNCLYGVETGEFLQKCETSPRGSFSLGSTGEINNPGS